MKKQSTEQWELNQRLLAEVERLREQTDCRACAHYLDCLAEREESPRADCFEASHYAKRNPVQLWVRFPRGG